MAGVGGRSPHENGCVRKWCGRDEAVSVVVDDGKGHSEASEDTVKGPCLYRSGVVGRYVWRETDEICPACSVQLSPTVPLRRRGLMRGREQQQEAGTVRSRQTE